jgi:hypothetical protein
VKLDYSSIRDLKNGFREVLREEQETQTAALKVENRALRARVDELLSTNNEYLEAKRSSLSRLATSEVIVDTLAEALLAVQMANGLDDALGKVNDTLEIYNAHKAARAT